MGIRTCRRELLIESLRAHLHKAIHASPCRILTVHIRPRSKHIGLTLYAFIDEATNGVSFTPKSFGGVGDTGGHREGTPPHDLLQPPYSLP